MPHPIVFGIAAGAGLFLGWRVVKREMVRINSERSRQKTAGGALDPGAQLEKGEDGVYRPAGRKDAADHGG